jgi:hypothetical protein
MKTDAPLIPSDAASIGHLSDEKSYEKIRFFLTAFTIKPIGIA